MMARKHLIRAAVAHSTAEAKRLFSIRLAYPNRLRR